MDSDTPDSTVVAVAAPAPASKAKISQFKLTVKFAFADYQVGQSIADADEVAAVLAGECAGNVLKVANA
ncbi:hypothetical protein [Pseudomonas fluorescens]|uniref:hypothetical protein n=1 Tax=Pseudomonas fluorescens TaxID=294 RepID=UPI003D251F18